VHVEGGALDILFLPVTSLLRSVKIYLAPLQLEGGETEAEHIGVSYQRGTLSLYIVESDGEGV
jgi:hypothetical protein